MSTKTNLLAEKAVLATLSISVWTARRFDASVTEDTHKRHNAQADAGRYNKLLIDKRDLKLLEQIRNAARTRHAQLTQPWFDDGSRLLPAALYSAYAADMHKLKDEFETEAAAFVRDYPAAIERAKLRLNGMFKSEDYPSVEDIQRSFGFDMRVLPCPDARDFRVDIASAQLAEMQADVEARMKQALETAMHDARDRIVGVVGHMAERLKAFRPSDGEDRAEGMFRDSLVENVRELVELLPAFNLTENAKLDAIIRKMNQELCAADADALREDASLRDTVAKAADKILTDVAAFMA